MKKTFGLLSHWFLYLIALAALVAIINFALTVQPQDASQGVNIQALEERLLQLGIPLKSLSVTRASPLEVEVVIQSSGSAGLLSNADMLNEFLTVRELELAHRDLALDISSYRLILVSDIEVPIYDGTIILHPDLPSQLLTKAPRSLVESGQAVKILEENLNLHGLQMLAVVAPARYATSDNSSLVTLEVSTGVSAEKTNNIQINEFIMDLRPQIQALNSRFGARIVVIHVWVEDSDGLLLVDYLEDFETGKQSSWVDQKYIAGWYPQPAPAISAELIETPALITATHAGSAKPPAPTTQPAAYPQPPAPKPYP